jgi:hypothetical protein
LRECLQKNVSVAAAAAAVMQALFSDLRAAYPAAHKPSGLTLVDSVGVADSKPSW